MKKTELLYTVDGVQMNLTSEKTAWAFLKLKTNKEGWRDGSALKSTGCSSRRPGFNTQHPHSSSQLSVTPAPGDPTPSDVFRHPQVITHVIYAGIYTLTYKLKLNK